MSSRTTIVLSLTLLLTALGWSSPAAARQPDESIPSTFQLFDCPVDYAGDDYLADCSPVGAGGWSITVTDTHPTEPTATTATDANGVISFATLPGPTRFDLAVPAATTLYYACFNGAGTFLRDGAERTIEFTLSEGDALSCRWYITPTGGTDVPASVMPSEEVLSTFAIHVLTCPDYYDGIRFREDCTPGSYDVSDGSLIGATNGEVIVGSTTERGLTEISQVRAGTYFIGVGVFRQYNEVYLSCFDVTSGSEAFLFDEWITVATLFATPPNNLITIEAGRDYSCRYYIIPGGTSPDTFPGSVPSSEPAPSMSNDPADASVGIQIFDCPEGYDGGDYAAACAPTERPVGVAINDGYEFDAATVFRDQAGDEGRAGFVDLFDGQYYLTVEDLSATTTIYWTCFTLDGDAEQFDRDGYHNRVRFFLGPSADYSCRIYLTSNGPTPPVPGTPGTVTVDVRGCPESYRGPDWAAQCTGLVDGNRVAITGYPGSRGGPNGLEIYEGTAIFEDVVPGTYTPVTDIPGHATNQWSACVIGAGPVEDGLINTTGAEDPSSQPLAERGITLGEGEGATCVIYIVPLSFRA